MSSPPQLSSFVNLLIFSKTENSLFKNTLILNREYATEKPSMSPPPFQFLATNLTDIQSHVCLSIRDSLELARDIGKIQFSHPDLQMRDPERREVSLPKNVMSVAGLWS